MDDKIISALQDIIGKQRAQRPVTAQDRHARADAYIALWKSKQKQVMQPAFQEFSRHLKAEYKIDSYYDDSVGMEALRIVADPGIRFIFRERPMFGEDSKASFFELRCISASQTLKASFEVHKGQDVESGSVEGTVALNDLTADWIHQQLTKVLAKSYGQEMPSENTPAPEVPAAENPTPDALADGAPAAEAPADGAPPTEATTDGAPPTQAPEDGAAPTQAPTDGATAAEPAAEGAPAPEALAQEPPSPESPAEASPSTQPQGVAQDPATEPENIQAPAENSQDNQPPVDAANAQTPAQDPKEPPP